MQSTHELTKFAMQTFVRLKLICPVLLLFTAIEAFANTAEDVAQSYYEALFRGGLSATIEYLHPDSITNFKETMMPVLRDGLLNGQETIASFFGPNTTIEVLERSNPRSFLISCFVLIDEFLIPATLENDGVQFVGTVAEGETRHVLLRISWDTGLIKATQLRVVSLKKDATVWKAMLPAEIVVVLDEFRTRVAAKNESHNKSLDADANDTNSGKPNR